ncbi:MAG: hypothetical protein ABEI52_03825, partial [Halobacteriaceae archaeon]
HVRHQDMMEQALEGFDSTGDGLVFHYEDGDDIYSLQETLSICDVDVIVCLNTEENKEELVEAWDTAIEIDPKIIFVNPKENSKWIVKPSLHDRVADPENLEEGFDTLQDNTVLVENN